MTTFALIAFDLDGTLADTESVSIPSAIKTLNDLGVPVTVEYWHEHFQGLKGSSLLALIKEQLGVEVDAQEYFRLRAEAVPTMFENGIAPAPGMLQALRNLVVSGQQVCICSNSTAERITYTLEKLTGQHSAGMNLPHMFEGHTFSAAGDKAKPLPYVYQNAATHYGVAPSKCLAVEDTVVGVQAAVAAGYTCLGYTGLSQTPEADAAKLTAHGAKAILPHWDEFLPLINTLKI